jgi:hypothetical protein
MERNELDLDLRTRRENMFRRGPGKLPGNLRQLGAVGRYVPPPLPGAPHTVVKGWTAVPQTTTDHLRYLQKGKGDLAPDSGTNVSHLRRLDAQLFTARGRQVEPDRFRLQSNTDPHQFRFVVSVRDSAASLLPEYIRDLMTLVERDTKRPLDWLAAVHEDTQQVHTHVLVRGRDRDGNDLYLTTPYLSEGIRRRAMGLALHYFGVVTGEHKQQEGQREILVEPPSLERLQRLQGKEQDLTARISGALAGDLPRLQRQRDVVRADIKRLQATQQEWTQKPGREASMER